MISPYPLAYEYFCHSCGSVDCVNDVYYQDNGSGYYCCPDCLFESVTYEPIFDEAVLSEWCFEPPLESDSVLNDLPF